MPTRRFFHEMAGEGTVTTVDATEPGFDHVSGYSGRSPAALKKFKHTTMLENSCDNETTLNQPNYDETLADPCPRYPKTFYRFIRLKLSTRNELVCKIETFSTGCFRDWAVSRYDIPVPHPHHLKSSFLSGFAETLLIELSTSELESLYTSELLMP
jgi:hypothetical protein